MSPVFNDKFDALMHPKRQVSETGSATASDAPPTTTPQPPTSSTSSTTSAVSTTSSSSSTSQISTTSSTTSLITTSTTSLVTTTATTPTSTSASTTSALPTTTTPVVTTTAVTTRAVSTTAASSISRTAIIVSPTLIRSTSDGQIITVTAVVQATDSASTSNSGKPFFKNTGAVVGVFVVVGIIAMALLFVVGTMFLRRRRAKQFDREVQEAAREAAHTQPPLDDDDDYAGATSYNTHGSQPMSTERPGGYGGYGAAASSWDPYGRAATGPTGYEMQHRRTSTGAGPGVAGFATGDVFARNAAPEPQGYNQGYGQGYAQDSYNTGYGQAYSGNQQYNNQTYNTSPQPGYALAQPQTQTQAGRAPVQAQMMMPEAQRHSYNNVGAFRQSPSYGEAHPGEHVEYGHATQQDEDPYGGYEAYDAGPSQTQSQAHASNPPAYAAGTSGTAGATGDRKGSHVARQPSASGRSGATRYSSDDDDVEPPRRVLKVANE